MTEQVAACIARHDPVAATEAGFSGHDHRLPDYSPEAAAAFVAELKSLRAQIVKLPQGKSRFDTLAADIALWHIDYLTDLRTSDEYPQWLDIIDSPYQKVRDVFDLMDRPDDIQQRLDGLDACLRGYRELLASGKEAGLVASARQVEAVAGQAREHARSGGAFDRTAAEHGLDPSRATAAAADFAMFLESDYLPFARAEDAFGRERYGWWARRYLGDDVDLDDTYAWGWTQVSSLLESMAAAAQQISATASVDDVLQRLARDPAEAASSEEEFVALMAERQHAAMERLNGSVFEIPERGRHVDVRIAPYGGALGASYTQPSEDFSRPGIVWYSVLEGQQHFPLFDEISTAYHEGFPGHHLQEAIAVDSSEKLTGLHRTMVWYSGFGEGWALYAERLMHELGFLERPEYVLGYLSSQMLRACRVVIDIGLHLGLRLPSSAPLGAGSAWTAELAVEYLVRFARLAPPNARSEVTRYLGWPGQAISYKVGERVIHDLRESERARLGSEFDLKAFHAAVLESGPVPLGWLGRLVTSATG